MIPLKQAIMGVLEFVQTDVVATMNAGAPKKIMASFAIGMLAKNIDNTCNQITNNPYYAMAKQWGIVNQDDTIDLDTAAPMLKDIIKKDGLVYTTKTGDTFKFDENDVDTLVVRIKSFSN